MTKTSTFIHLYIYIYLYTPKIPTGIIMEKYLRKLLMMILLSGKGPVKLMQGVTIVLYFYMVCQRIFHNYLLTRAK